MKRTVAAQIWQAFKFLPPVPDDVISIRERAGRIKTWLMAGALVSLLSACASPGDDLPPLPTPAVAEGNYSLGPGDRLQIVIYGTDEPNVQYTVSDAGFVGAPLIGPIKASGLTVTDFQNQLASRLSQGFIEKPKVSVEVIAYRPFYILGAVSKPGAYPFAPGTIVESAVATAGGYTYRANESFAVVDRGDVRGRAKPGDMVLPGDVIHVSERYF